MSSTESVSIASSKRMLITEQHFQTVLRVVKIKLMDTSYNEVVDYIFMNGILLKESNNKHTTVRDYRL